MPRSTNRTKLEELAKKSYAADKRKIKIEKLLNAINGTTKYMTLQMLWWMKP